MKIRLAGIFLIIFIFALFPTFAQKSSSVTISGQLLKANGKPLPYVELELVPIESDVLVFDQRLIAASSTSGKFSFINVPDGKYTLSVNFGDKPSNLSPYPEYFYPNTYKRGAAQIFEVTRTSKFAAVVFRLPPPLVERRVSGKVSFSDGTPVRGAFVALRDVLFDSSVYFGAINTDVNGNFSAKGFEGREYQFGAILFENEDPNRYDLRDPIIAAGESAVFRLGAQTPVIKFEVKTKGDHNLIKDKYLGMKIIKRLYEKQNLTFFARFDASARMR